MQVPRNSHILPSLFCSFIDRDDIQEFLRDEKFGSSFSPALIVTGILSHNQSVSAKGKAQNITEDNQ